MRLRTNSGPLDRTHPRPGCCDVWRTTTRQPKFVGPKEGSNYPPVVGRARGTTEYYPLVSAWVENGTLTNGREKNKRLDPRRAA